MPPPVDITNKVFGRLKARKQIGTKWGSILWEFRCYCGNLCEATIGQVTRANKPKESCGHCYDNKKYPKEYITWQSMKQRCNCPTADNYKHYGGRGIIVCYRWQKDFLHFLEDMGLRPSDEHTIERKDVDGNYEPSNCVWLHHSYQGLNRRNSYRLCE